MMVVLLLLSILLMWGSYIQDAIDAGIINIFWCGCWSEYRWIRFAADRQLLMDEQNSEIFYGWPVEIK